MARPETAGVVLDTFCQRGRGKRMFGGVAIVFSIVEPEKINLSLDKKLVFHALIAVCLFVGW